MARCKEAAVALGFTGDTVDHADYEYDWMLSWMPRGCFQSDADDTSLFHFNRGKGGNAVGTDKILCIKSAQGEANKNNSGEVKMASCLLLISFFFAAFL